MSEIQAKVKAIIIDKLGVDEKDVVAEADYDISKNLFEDGYADPDDQKQWVENLIKMVSRHIEIEDL